MAHFAAVNNSHGLRWVNLDLVREAHTGMDGKLTLKFDSSHSVVIQGADAGEVEDELNNLSPKRATAA